MHARTDRHRHRKRAVRPGGGAHRTAGGIAVIALLIATCGGPPSVTPPQPSAVPTPGPATTPRDPQRGSVADAIFIDANVITMDDERPRAEAVAIAGGTILAVGTNDEVAAFRGPATSVVSLGGRTLVPGFIDAHQHRIGDGPARLGVEPRALVDAAIAQGYTTIHELYVDAARLGDLRALDDTGMLRLRVNAYLAANENSPEGRVFDPYWTEWQPGQRVSPHVRVAGLKVFTDFDNATVLLWYQGDLNAFLLDRHREGWQLAVKTVSTTSLAMILSALEAARAADPLVLEARVRLEHMLFATPEQIAAIEALGVVPAINTNVPGQLVGEPDIDALIAREPADAYAPWRSVADAGIPAAGISGFPSLWVDEPTGAPFGSPIHLVYQAVTRAGNLGVQSPAHLLDQALTVQQALRAHTIHAAWAAFEDDVKGSITPGKLADLVVLSANPLAVPAEEINAIETLMTMIGGRVEHCAVGWEAVCPGPAGAAASPVPTQPGPSGPADGNLAREATVTASSELPGAPASNVIDGTDAHWNAAAGAPQWIELALASPGRVAGFRLVVAQDPGGPSVHELWVGRAGGAPERLHLFDGLTTDGDVLVFAPAAPLSDVTIVRVVTTSLGDLFPAWREIEVLGG
ncbi:MAG: hypothetical protein A2V85_02925 [Chloroflexi bacterium RBG_16_72_14]|nr:MAG: hypothetical protein A2V85_02925 [Chloroflexi bacterium RBG_16_72_14]